MELRRSFKINPILVFLNLFILISACNQEDFSTGIDIKLHSRIKNLSVLPCKVVLTIRTVEDNLMRSYSIVDTMMTDTMGNLSMRRQLGKLKKNQFYEVELLESKWQLPTDREPFLIKAGIHNSITFNVKPKWRHTVHLEDSSGKFSPTQFSCYNSLTLNYYQNELFNSFPTNGFQDIYISAPDDAYIYLTLNLTVKSTNERITISKKYESNNFDDIWLRF